MIPVHDVFVCLTDCPIIVTGCARSGTSMIAGVLYYCGAWGGKMTMATRWNKKGQFENEVLRDKLTKPFLSANGWDSMGQQPLPPIDFRPTKRQVEDWRHRVLSAIKAEGYNGVDPWMFKGAKAALVWRLWHEAFPKARWVLTRRKDEGIIRSCLKTSFMRKRKSEEEWQDWIDHHKQCFQDMVLEGLNITEIWPGESVSNGSLGQLQVLVNRLGLCWNEDKVRGFVTKDLWTGG